MSAFTSDDHRFMSRALQLAERGLYTTDPNPRVGCVVVQAGEIVGEGWHVEAGGLHAEVHALQQAGTKAKDATVYVTLEPCSHYGQTPPCADALIAAFVKRVVVAMEDPNPKVSGAGLQRLQFSGVETFVGLMEDQAEALNPGFVSRHRQGRPYIRCKMAMSLDGRTSMASGESKWITSDAARQDVQRLRARSSAIVTGIGTVLADDPLLNARVDEAVKQPVRVVVNTQLRFPPFASMLEHGGEVWIATASHSEEPENMPFLENVKLLDVPLNQAGTGVNLVALCRLLAIKEINEVLLEAGPTLSGAMIGAGLVDELVIYMAPHLMGDTANALFHLPGLESMSQRLALNICDVRNVGADLRITARLQS